MFALPNIYVRVCAVKTVCMMAVSWRFGAGFPVIFTRSYCIYRTVWFLSVSLALSEEEYSWRPRLEDRQRATGGSRQADGIARRLPIVRQGTHNSSGSLLTCLHVHLQCISTRPLLTCSCNVAG